MIMKIVFVELENSFSFVVIIVYWIWLDVFFVICVYFVLNV